MRRTDFYNACHVCYAVRSHATVALGGAYSRPSDAKKAIWLRIRLAHASEETPIGQPTIFSHNCQFFSAGYLFADENGEIFVRLYYPSRIVTIPAAELSTACKL